MMKPMCPPDEMGRTLSFSGTARYKLTPNLWAILKDLEQASFGEYTNLFYLQINGQINVYIDVDK